jgi:hypothetical protein
MPLRLTDSISLLNSNTSSEYLVNDDMVGLFLKARKGNGLELHLDPTVLVQGNKNTLIKYVKQDIKLWKGIMRLSNSIVILGVIRIGLYFMKNFWKWLYEDRNEYTQRTSSLKEVCCKCNIRTANIVMLECNHFNLCYTCFQEEK